MTNGQKAYEACANALRAANGGKCALFPSCGLPATTAHSPFCSASHAAIGAKNGYISETPAWEALAPEHRGAWEAFAEGARGGMPPDEAYNKLFLRELKGLTVDKKPAPAFQFFVHNAPAIAKSWDAAWAAARS